MLTSLRIENFAIVKQLDLEFFSGMSAFTGETGAGKSIMIDALMLALGGRADVSLIRPNEQKCDITASFQIDENSEPAAWLKKHDISMDEGGLYLRRVLYAEGRSKSYINGQPFPLQKVKELSEMLVHIHGQHQHQTLLHAAAHRQQLDVYAGHSALLNETGVLYKACQSIRQQIEKLRSQSTQQDKVALLEFQLNELNHLQAETGEMSRLSAEHELLHNANHYLNLSGLIVAHLSSEDSPDICRQLNQVLHHLADLPDEHSGLKNAAGLLETALIQCEEALNEVRHFAEDISLDPQRLQEVENRISALHEAARKYHVDPDELSSCRQLIEQELSSLQNNEEIITALEKRCQEQQAAFQSAAGRLSQSRQQAALKLSGEITAIINQLGMPKGKITVQIDPLDKMHPHGLDRVEYKVQTNPGAAADSLNKIASGGELSRISLAIQMVTAQRGATPTLLFDEVDVGIGGATAALVGRHLRQLGERLQVFCVTHQPQVASAAHHHFRVEKISGPDETFSNIISLDQPSKIDEIARMLGGLTITDQTRSHARELLDLSCT